MQELLTYISDLCDDEVALRDPQLLRFAAHLVLTLLQLSEDLVDENNVKDKVSEL